MERRFDYKELTVSLGGGTGHFGYLRGAVKINHPDFNVAIPATWDGKGDNQKGGGKSGELRISKGVLPPGDIMQCLVALMTDECQFNEAMLIIKDRSFDQPIANMLHTVAEQKHHDGQEGVDALRRLFQVRSRIVLPTLDDINLLGETKNGRNFKAEGDIDLLKEEDGFSFMDEISRIYFDYDPSANPLAIASLRSAKRIVFTAGSPYTSIFPQLLIKGNREAILESNAKLEVALNLTCTRGEDHHLDLASKWLRVFQYYLRDDEYIKANGKSRIDLIVAQDHRCSDPVAVEYYANKGQKVVKVDKDECLRLAPGVRIEVADLADYDRDKHLFRYDPVKLAQVFFAF